ncbi:MAG TPA: hypothetical protein PK014_10030 [Thermoanaerobaculia bacterium]|nr:hypothetical protein [Thermoanaerobaculia bacterium]HUM30456.1 hypothetical protein [Thermoanaerobaculia bacterium]HXK68677.1 hypothetical protein [Thermoanaerobaculia bacterium]
MRKVLFLVAMMGLVAAVALAATPFRTAPGTEVFIPSAAHAPGAAGTFWRTDVRIFNNGSALANVTAYDLVRNADNSAAHTASFTVPAGGSVNYEDVYVSLFEYDDAGIFAGGIRFMSDQAIVVASKTFTPKNIEDLTEGTYGQYIAGVPIENFVAPSSRAMAYTDLLFVDDIANTYRTNFGLVNGVGTTTSVTMAMYDENNNMVGSAVNVDLLPYEAKQWNVTEQGWAGVTNGRLRLTANSGKFAGFVTNVNYGTGDGIYVDGTNTTGGGGTTPPPVTGQPSGWYQGGVLYYDPADDYWYPMGPWEFNVNVTDTAATITDINTFNWVFRTDGYLSTWGVALRGVSTGNEDALMSPITLPDVGATANATVKFRVTSTTDAANYCDYAQVWEFTGLAPMGFEYYLTETRVCKGAWSVLGGLQQEWLGWAGVTDSPFLWGY